ncbi:hypothetical protein BEN30_11365 [Magnetovibrio blakemorei]|uniref:Uncharacterized protein n=2 Tax=Magnetovibrio blakemorei TaxID=28181 RepID=A0A1E5Q751_9PROT|nr:hypothetical protein BEN30_11365 [Magnetovibrio blakemorei]
MVLVFPNLFQLTVLNFQPSPNFISDPEFNIHSALDASPYKLDYYRQLARAQSQDEFDYISNKITKEQKYRQGQPAWDILSILAMFAVITVSSYLVLTTLNYFATNWEEKTVRVYGFVSAIWVIGSSSSYFWVVAPSWTNLKHIFNNLGEISLMAFGPVICVIALKVIYEKYIR